jgi:hypothetical protein
MKRTFIRGPKKAVRLFGVIMILAACFALLSLAGCAPAGAVVPPGDPDAWSHNNDGTFEINIYTDKDEYKAGEPILCWATVEYVGEGDGITIYSSDPLVGFGLKDGRYFDGEYWVNDVLITTEFTKGETEAYEFTKSGTWDADDPDAAFYEQFFKEKDFTLPAGDYEISATLDGFLNQDDYEGSKYKLSVHTGISVKE